MELRLEHAGRTDVGRVRRRNEDDWFADPALGVYGVADGMGGHAAGDVASRLATEAAHEVLRTRLADAGGDRVGPPRDEEALRESLSAAVSEANRAILEEAGERPERQGMGTTLTLLAVTAADAAVVAHVGDSRAYRIRGGHPELLTRDHNPRPGSSVLTRALGVQGEARPDLERTDVRPGDLFLLCSDGLTDLVPDGPIVEILHEAGVLEEPPGPGAAGPAEHASDEGLRDRLEAAAAALVDEANRRGGRDNVTVVLVAARPRRRASHR